MRFALVTASLLVLCPFGRVAIPNEVWPEFRGPGGQGHSTAKDLPLRWSETDNVRWRTTVPGEGWSSPVIEDDEIWLTTSISSNVNDEERAARTAGDTGGQPLVVSGRLELRAVGIDRSTGRILRDVLLLEVAEPEPIHDLNSFASPTPVLEKGRLYAHFGTNGTACVDTTTGAVVWKNRDLELRHENGPGSSPISWRDLIVVHCDGSDVQYIAALRKSDGSIAWKTDRSGSMHANPQMKKAYGTPLVVEIGGRPQLVSPAADWLYAYDPGSGEELWRLAYGDLGFSIVPRPVTGHGLVYFSTSFMRPRILAVRIDGADGRPEPHVAWEFSRQAPQMPSPLLVEDRLYFVSDSGGVATCVDAKTGEERWRHRLGGNFSASPLYADGRIYFSDRDGATTVIDAGPELEVLATNRLEGRHMASPIALGRALYLRTDRALYRIETTEADS